MICNSDNIHNLKSSLSMNNCEFVLNLVDVDDAYNLFLGLLMINMDSACPSKKARMNHKLKGANKYNAETSRLRVELQTPNNRYLASYQ